MSDTSNELSEAFEDLCYQNDEQGGEFVVVSSETIDAAISEHEHAQRELAEARKALADAEKIVADIAQWSKKWPKGCVYSFKSEAEMHGRLCEIEVAAKQYAAAAAIRAAKEGAK